MRVESTARRRGFKTLGLASIAAMAVAAAGIVEDRVAARVNYVDLAPLDEVIAAGLGDETIAFQEVRSEFDALFTAFSTTQDPKALRGAFDRFAKGVIAHYQRKGQQFDREALSRLTFGTARRGQMHFVAGRLALVDAGTPRSAEEWIDLAGLRETPVASGMQPWPGRKLSRREFLGVAFVEPAVRFGSVHHHEPPRPIPASVQIRPARLEWAAPAFLDCRANAEACFDECEGGPKCLDGNCEGARCCGRKSIECDQVYGFWTCTYEYLHCLAKLVIPYLP
jgi:hypothetical protein